MTYDLKEETKICKANQYQESYVALKEKEFFPSQYQIQMRLGVTYPSQKPWPRATSGCRRSWPWWSRSGQSSWWWGRWRCVSSLCRLPHLPSFSLRVSVRPETAATRGAVSQRKSSWLRMTSRPEEFNAAKPPLLLLENMENFTLTHGELANDYQMVGYSSTILTFTSSLVFTARKHRAAFGLDSWRSPFLDTNILSDVAMSSSCAEK